MFVNITGSESVNFLVVATTDIERLRAFNQPDNLIHVMVDGYEGFVFSDTEPEAPTENLLWLKTTTTGPYKISATRRNPIYVRPTNVYIYKTGAWKLLVAYIRLNGKWCDLSKLDALNEKWSGIGKGFSGEGGSIDPTFEDGSLLVDFTENRWGTSVRTGTWLTDGKAYDLTNYTKLTFKGYFTKENSNSYGIYGVWTNDDYKSYKEDVPVKWETTADNSADVVLDVTELTGEHYIGVGIRSCKVRIDECYLEM